LRICCNYCPVAEGLYVFVQLVLLRVAGRLLGIAFILLELPKIVVKVVLLQLLGFLPAELYVLVQLVAVRELGRTLGTCASLSAFVLSFNQLLRKSAGNVGIPLIKSFKF
jgi:hypothetical protein